MANEKNLVQNSGRTRNEVEELSRKGGINSGISRRKKRDMRESMQAILETPLTPQQLNQLKPLGLKGSDYKLADMVNIMAVQQAFKGNVRAMEFVRDTAGYSPDQQLKEEQFEYERERKSGQGAEIEDVSAIVTEIWGYDMWMRMMKDGVPVILTKTTPYNFSKKHVKYIRKCQDNTYNILEGAIRAGKTVDHILAFAIELCSTPDKFHLATGSTMANAKMNIGDSNGFGLEHIFRGQSRWTRYKDNDALIIRGPYTNFEEKVVVFAGGGASNSFKKIRGSSFGMWIATEINLHHDSFIKEAFNRTAAAERRKFFWDLNPAHPKDPIYTEYIDLYQEKAEAGELKGGFNYQHCTIFDNVNISKERLEEIVSQYDKESIWYIRDIIGKRSIAEGLVYPKLAASITAKDGKFQISRETAVRMSKESRFKQINVGVDFGGNGSGHAFVASAPADGYGTLVALASEWHDAEGTDPEDLSKLFIAFIKKIIRIYGYVTRVYCDSAEQVLMRGLKNALAKNGMGNIRIGNAQKSKITNRIFTLTTLSAQERFLYTEDCESLTSALSMAVWNPKNTDLERLDDGTSDIDTLDAFEYSYEHDINKLVKKNAAGR